MTFALDRKGVAHEQLPHILETVCGRKRRHNPKWSWAYSADRPSLRQLCGKCAVGRGGASA